MPISGLRPISSLFVGRIYWLTARNCGGTIDRTLLNAPMRILVRAAAPFWLLG